MFRTKWSDKGVSFEYTQLDPPRYYLAPEPPRSTLLPQAVSGTSLPSVSFSGMSGSDVGRWSQVRALMREKRRQNRIPVVRHPGAQSAPVALPGDS